MGYSGDINKLANEIIKQGNKKVSMARFLPSEGKLKQVQKQRMAKIEAKIEKASEKFHDKVESEVEGYAVYVGIPQKYSSRPGERITNAELAFIHTNGSPVKNIPPRPFVQPAIEAHQTEISQMLLDAFAYIMGGKKQEGVRRLNVLGIFAVEVVKDMFKKGHNNWPPLKPETIKRKGSDLPLVDTGEMRNSITYVIKTPEKLKIAPINTSHKKSKEG